MSLLYGWDGEGAVPTNYFDGGICVDALVVVVPGEDGRRIAGDRNIEDYVLSFTYFKVVRKVVNDWFVVLC